MPHPLPHKQAGALLRRPLRDIRGNTFSRAQQEPPWTALLAAPCRAQLRPTSPLWLWLPAGFPGSVAFLRPGFWKGL